MSEFEYKIKFWNPQKAYQKYGEEIFEEIKKVAESGLYVLGPTLERFEQEFAKYIGTKYAIGVNSGTDALYIALRAAGIGPGDKVITVSNTFIATIESIVRCGAIPLLVDITEDYLMDIDQVEKLLKIEDNIKAIIPVHLSGDVVDMDRLKELSDKFNIFLLEDAAQAFGSTWNTKRAGSIGNAGCFSLYPAKILGVWGDGGVITTNDESLYQECLLLRDHYKFTQSGHYTGKMPEKVKWIGNSRLDDIQAAVGLVRLRHIDQILSRRKEISYKYNSGLRHLPQLVVPFEKDNRVWQDYVLRILDKREELIKWLDSEGIKIRGIGITPNHLINGLELEHFKLPKNEKYISEFLRLPLNPEMEDWEIDYVIDKIKNFYEKNSI